MSQLITGFQHDDGGYRGVIRVKPEQGKTATEVRWRCPHAHARVWEARDCARAEMGRVAEDSPVSSRARPSVLYDIPLGDGEKAQLILPADLTQAEADRLCGVIQTLPIAPEVGEDGKHGHPQGNT